MIRDMRQRCYIVIILLLSISYFFASCTGQEDEANSEIPILILDKTMIRADGKEQVSFRVESAGRDVTSQSVIHCQEDSKVLPNPFFTTSKVGLWTFYATYQGQQSRTVELKSTESVLYERHVCLMKFTGTWCTFCPTGGRTIQYVLEDKKYKNVHLLAFYGGSPKEPMLIPETDLLMKRLQSNSYPTMYIDMREGGSVSLNKLRESLDRSLDDYPAYYGVGITSKLTSDESMATVDVEIAAGITSSYRVILYAVEDNLVYAQLDNGIMDEDFIHNHVVRRLYSQSILGDPINELKQGETTVKQYSLQLESNWNPENLSFYALVIDDSTGFIHNMACCKAIDGQMTYHQE